MSQFFLHPLLRLVAFIVAFGLLVTVHEFGHFYVARRLGFKVLRFSVGFGKPLWKRTAADGIEYWIAAFPIGGYVKMLDEREGEVAPEELSRSFTRRPHWQRLLVLLAGPTFNIVSAVLLLTGLLYASGLTQVRPVLGSIDSSSILGRAGVHSGDEIVAINGAKVSAQNEVQLDLLDALSSNAPLVLTLSAPNGVERNLEVSIPGTAERRRLTEPAAMNAGLGLNFYEPPIPTVIAAVEPHGPAARAGLAAGDRIVGVNNMPVQDFVQFQKFVQAHPADTLSIRYRRGSSEATVAADHARAEAAERQGHRWHRHSGERAGGVSTEHAAAHKAVVAGGIRARQCRGVGYDRASGAHDLAHARQQGLDQESERPAQHRGVRRGCRRRRARLVPVLSGHSQSDARLHESAADSDPGWGSGGLFQVIEWLKGSPLSERVQVIGQQLGVALLVLLMGVALFNDISQFG